MCREEKVNYRLSNMKNLQRKISNQSFVNFLWNGSIKDAKIETFLNKMDGACLWKEDQTNASVLHENVLKLFQEVESEVVRLGEQKRHQALKRIVYAMNQLLESVGHDVLKECGRKYILREVVYYKK